MANSNLTSAKKAKNDEFYTQYADIQKEIEAYLDFNKDTFKGKVVYCNCDDPLESNFFGFFADNFKRLKLKRLITTSYKPSPVSNTLFDLSPYNTEHVTKGREKEFAARFIIDDVGDHNGDGTYNRLDLFEQLKANKNNEWQVLKGDAEYSAGDFRSKECLALLKQADIVVTNPPFSLFREYIKQVISYDKKFIIVGNMNAITYKEIFPMMKDDEIWLGNGFNKGNAYFAIPSEQRSDYADGVYDEQTGLVKFRNVCWFTNIDHGRRHQPLSLRNTRSIFKRPKHKVFEGRTAFDTYDNYDAIEVPFTDSIPSDYDGVMGVPISFLDKYNPEQFEIIGSDAYDGTPATKKYSQKEKVVNGNRMKSQTGTMGCVIKRDDFGQGTYFDVGYPVQAVYKRIFIKHRKTTHD